MNDQPQHQNATPDVPHSSQNAPADAQAVSDNVMQHQLPTANENSQGPAAPGDQQAGPGREIGEPTAPMPRQPGTTIQVPALPTEGAPAPTSTPATENENTLLAIPQAPAVPDKEEQQAASARVQPTPAVAPTPTPPSPQPARPAPFLSAEDLAEIQVLAEPQVSPDGLLIAYTLLKNDVAANRTRGSIWLAPAVIGSTGKLQQPRQLTSETLHSTTPRWSPDGRWLAFLSDRGGSAQVYLLPLNGGEARQVSFLPQPVSDLAWRPDGRALLLQSPWKIEDDEPDRPDETVAQVWTRLDESHDGDGYKHGRHEHLWLLNLEDQQPPARLTFEPVDHVQACWSPDGKEVAFCANRRTAPDLSLSKGLWILNLAAGHMRRLTPLEGVAMQPAWSSDGKWLAYYYQADQSETANVVPWIVAADGKTAPRPATTISQSQTGSEIKGTVNRPCWYPDSTSLMVTVQARGQVHINRLYINTDHEEPLTTGNGCYLSPHLSTNGRTIAALRTDWFTPGDLWAMAGNGVSRRRLTGVNDSFLHSHQLIRPKKINWRSFDDQEIEGWLYLPTLPAGTRAPLVLSVHGGPATAWGESYLHDAQVLAGLGYAVLTANPRGSTGYGEDFCRKNIDDWGGDDYRDLMLGLDHVIATEPIDGARLAITGASYGGYMTCWAISQSKRFKAAVARNPITSLLTCAALSDETLWFDLNMGTPAAPQNPEALRRMRSPLTFANAITTPLLLIHAADDLRCPPGESLQLFGMLRRRQHQVELVSYPGASHVFDVPGRGSIRQRIDRVKRSCAWIKKYV